MLAMLRHIVYEGLRTRRTRPTYFFQAARSVEDRLERRRVGLTAVHDALRTLSPAATLDRGYAVRDGV